ncbi:hypothetical protein [Pseudophaeobacter arcticus]|uniref:hypothetical protein n=1 Tax=Pseudophaeobacter arcticus TaxID=385492 RepID=UPI003A96CCFF
MNFSTIAGVFLALATAVPAAAQEYRIGNLNKQAFIVTVSGGRLGVPVGTGASFCPAQNKVFHKCAFFKGLSGFMNSEGFTPGGGTFWSKRKNERKYGIALSHGKFKGSPGRYYFTGQHLGNRSYNVGDITYFADLAPGNVVVFPRGGVPMKEAIAYAREQMVANMGEKALALNFVPGGAVSVTCDHDAPKAPCRVGKQVSLSSVSFSR